MKRIYKVVSVAVLESGDYEVRLDQHALRTPAKAPMPLPTAALAEAIAAEWEAQHDAIRPHSMPLTQLVSTAYDKVRPERAKVADGICAFAETDLLCYRASSPVELMVRQARQWQPWLDWIRTRYGAPLVLAEGIMPVQQPPAALAALRQAVAAFDDLHLIALQTATSACGSLVLALALVEGVLDAETAYALSQLDESYQSEIWGEDREAQVHRAGLKADIIAARHLIDLIRDTPRVAAALTPTT